MAKQPGLDQRHRDKDGEIHHKMGNTKIGTLRETYGDDFAKGRRSDMKLENLLKDTGAKGLIQEARLLVHLRNTICHMSTISAEEIDRIKQTMRDWFRIVAP